MVPGWKTLRGDEWWYSDHIVDASGVAELHSSPPRFTLSIRPKSLFEFNATSLFVLLRQTRAQLPDLEIWCVVDDAQKRLLAELTQDGLLTCQFLDELSEGQVRIVALSRDVT